MDSRTGKVISKEEFDYLDEKEKAYYIDISEKERALFEKAEMLRETIKNEESKTKAIHKGSMRNKPCPCGSGKKFKKCCLHSYS